MKSEQCATILSAAEYEDELPSTTPPGPNILPNPPKTVSTNTTKLLAGVIDSSTPKSESTIAPEKDSSQNSKTDQSTVSTDTVADASTKNSNPGSGNAASTTTTIDNADISSQNSSDGADNSVVNPLECKKVGRFAHPSSCTKYYYCWLNTGLAHEFNCPEHRAFDPISQHCVENFGVCSAAPKCNNDKEIITNPDNKWSFFECILKQNESNEFELHCKPCADDREYDDKLGYCKVASVNGEMLLDSDEFTDDSICGETGLFIDYEDDTKYYECVVRSVARGILKAIHHKCPMFHVFSMNERKCVALSILAKSK